MKSRSAYLLSAIGLGVVLALGLLWVLNSGPVGVVRADAAQVGAQATTVLLSEGFESSVPPAGWMTQTVVSVPGYQAGAWARSASTVHPSGVSAHGGSYLAYFNSYDTYDAVRLYRAGLNFSAAGGYYLSLWMYHDTGWPGADDYLQVEVAAGSGWVNAGNAISRTDGTTGWAQHTLDLSAYAGQVISVSLKGVSNYGNDIHIDDVVVYRQTAGTSSAVYLPLILKSPTVDVSINRIKVIQGTTMNSAYTVHVADRAATIRTFVSLIGATSQPLAARLTCYQAGAIVATVDTTGTVPASVDESILAQTLNFNLADTSLCVNSGVTHTIQLDPANVLPEISETNNTYVASGAQAFNFRYASPLTIMVVPVQYTDINTHITTSPPTADLSYLTWLPMKVYPVSQINYQVHSVVTFNGDLTQGPEWTRLLNQITTLHNSEDPGGTKLYFGLVDSGCPGGSCYLGMGWIGAPTAVGFAGYSSSDRTAAGETLTHEAGHNFNRYHAPGCGATGVDGSFPPAYIVGGKAMIGTYGLDVVAGILKPPASYYDYMSYCTPFWTSDYTYKAVFDYRLTSSYRQVGASEATEAFYISGWLDAQDRVTLSPLYAQTASVELAPAGEYRVELRGADGQVLVARPFAVTEMADGPAPQWGFHFFMPAVAGVTQVRIYHGDVLLAERSAAGPAPAVQFATLRTTEAGQVTAAWAPAAGVVYRLRFSPDGGQTWQVAAVDYADTTFTVPADWLAGALQPVLEVQATDGVRTDTQIIKLYQK